MSFILLLSILIPPARKIISRFAPWAVTGNSKRAIAAVLSAAVGVGESFDPETAATTGLTAAGFQYVLYELVYKPASVWANRSRYIDIDSESPDLPVEGD